MERRLLLDVVVAERTAVLQLLTREDKTLLVRRNTLLVLDLGGNQRLCASKERHSFFGHVEATHMPILGTRDIC